MPYLGEIRIFGGTFAPAGWEFCNGQLLSVSSNGALFSILGTTYGGNGSTTFALPDLRGRFPMGWDMGFYPAPGLSSRGLGEMVGTQAVALRAEELPAHSHQVPLLSASRATDTAPAGNVYGKADVDQYAPASSAGPALPMLRETGGGNAHNNESPFLEMAFIICVAGAYPSRP